MAQTATGGGGVRRRAGRTATPLAIPEHEPAPARAGGESWSETDSASEAEAILREESDSSYLSSQEDGYMSPAATNRARSIARRRNASGRQLGVTLDGLRVFALPETFPHVEGLVRKCLSPAALLTWACLAFSLAVAVFLRQYPWTILIVAVFWRLCCNLVLGLVLKRQSENASLTLWIESLRQQPFSSANSVTALVLRSNMPGDSEVLNDNTLPPSFPAWIALRCLVNLFESNDVWAFTLTAIQYGLSERSIAAESSRLIFKFLWPLADVVGFLLIALSLYSKLAARRTAGDYAWYWGDFFFLRTGSAELSFDGVFELFPHPMYTVGYGWTYGCAILARSFTVLAVGMAFHLSQLLFLTLVEVPHVEKLYGTPTEIADKVERFRLDAKFGVEASEPVSAEPVVQVQQPPGSKPAPVEEVANEPGSEVSPKLSQITLPTSVRTQVATDSPPNSSDEGQASTAEAPPQEHGFGHELAVLVPELAKDAAIGAAKVITLRSNVFVIRNFDFYRASDVNLVLSLLFFVLAAVLGSYPGGPLDDDAFFVCLALFWHVVSSVTKALILVRQEKTKFWTRHHVRQGRGRQAAFESWKRLYNMLQSLQHISFLLCAGRLFSMPSTWADCFRPEYVSQMICGTMLVLISLWSFSSCYDVLGDYGWFYGDFFLPPPSQRGEKTGPANPSLRSHQPSYEGIYRYLNNPDAYLGHLWLYGFALLGSSTELFIVALLSHAMKIAFLQTVEKPHFRQVYKQHVRKHSTALGRVLRGKVTDIRSNETAMFLANWVKHPIETGALAPSSEQLAEAMCETMELGDNSVVVELGPGTGPFTKEILKIQARHKNTTYIAFELNEEFISKLRQSFPEHQESFLNESAEKIVAVLKERGIDHCDTIISGLPWAIFPHSLQESILDQVYKALRPGGRFCTFAYLQGLVMPAGQNFKALLDRVFDGKVERSPIVWMNLPPAFVYRCEKAK